MRRAREFPLERPKAFWRGLGKSENPVWVFRSEYERRQAIRLIKNEVYFEYEMGQINFLSKVVNGECFACGYPHVGKRREYTPDFYFPETHIYVETKGKFDGPTRTKMKEVCEQSTHDIRMVFMRDNWLTRKHKMTYGRWCDLHEIPWAIGDIPIEWGKK